MSGASERREALPLLRVRHPPLRGIAGKEEGSMPVAKLARHELFELLTPKEMERVSNASGMVRLEAGQRVCLEGAPATHLFILLKGRVELRKPTEVGLSLLIDDLIGGDIIGISSITGTGRYVLDAECVEESEVLRVEAATLRAILEELMLDVMFEAPRLGRRGTIRVTKSMVEKQAIGPDVVAKALKIA